MIRKWIKTAFQHKHWTDEHIICGVHAGYCNCQGAWLMLCDKCKEAVFVFPFGLSGGNGKRAIFPFCDPPEGFIANKGIATKDHPCWDRIKPKE